MPRNFINFSCKLTLFQKEWDGGGGQPPIKSELRAQSNKVGRLWFWGYMLKNIQGDSWGSIPPLHMPSLLPHDLCHGWSSSRWLLAQAYAERMSKRYSAGWGIRICISLCFLQRWPEPVVGLKSKRNWCFATRWTWVMTQVGYQLKKEQHSQTRYKTQYLGQHPAFLLPGSPLWPCA